jgi:hypothetical protein
MTSKKTGSPDPMSCAEFQENLPDLFASGNEGVLENPALTEHLRTCENCSALVRDLRYIAEQASLLLQPTHEPSDDVWKKIQESMASEGIQAATVNGDTD